MNKNYIIPILLINLLLIRSPLRAQNFCMTPSSTNVSNINRMLETAEGPVRSNNQSYPLRIYFHVIRKTDGTGGQSYSNVEQAYQILNNDFNPHNIFFVWNDSIDYIDYTPYYYLPNISIFNINNHSNGIDIYLYPDEIYGDGHGKGNGVGISSEYYVAGKYSFSPYPSLITSHVVSHEMGHVLFLWHTHQLSTNRITIIHVESGSTLHVDGGAIRNGLISPEIGSFIMLSNGGRIISNKHHDFVIPDGVILNIANGSIE